MCFSLKFIAQNVSLQNGGKINPTIFGQHNTSKDLGIDQYAM